MKKFQVVLVAIVILVVVFRWLGVGDGFQQTVTEVIPQEFIANFGNFELPEWLNFGNFGDFGNFGTFGNEELSVVGE
jgi:hypothetical protein